MTNIQFDTSGSVRGRNDGRLQRAADKIMPDGPVRWTDLSPFVQGYVEAMFDDIGNRRLKATTLGTIQVGALGFSDLAPETLARIMGDCAHAENVFEGLGLKTGAAEGARFYRGRNDGSLRGVFGVAYPPLTVCLGDDGKVYLRETAR